MSDNRDAEQKLQESGAPDAEEQQARAPERNGTSETGSAPGKSGAGKKRRRGRLAALLAVFFLVVLPLLLLAGGYAALQTERGQRLLQEKLNAVLQEKAAGVRITALGGSIPLAMHAGAELYDEKGVWLKVPSADVTLNVSHPFTRLGVSLVLDGAVLFRLPGGGNATAEKQSGASSPSDIRKTADSLSSLTEALPDWLPELSVDSIDVRGFSVARAVYAPDCPEAADSLAVDLQAALKAMPAKEAAPGAAWRHPLLDGWCRIAVLPKSASAQQNPGALPVLNGLSADRCALALTVKGAFPDAELHFTAESGQILAGGMALNGMKFAALLPPDAIAALAAGRDCGVKLSLSLETGKRPYDLNLTAGGALKDGGPEIFVKELTLSSPGMSLAGDMRAALSEKAAGTAHASAIPGVPDDLLQKLPACTGKLNLSVTDWTALNDAVPGISLKGPVSAELSLTHDGGQGLSLRASAPDFAAAVKPDTALDVKNFSLAADLRNVTDSPSVKADLSTGHARGFGRALTSLKLALDGDLQKGIAVHVGSAGDAAVEAAGLFRPGSVDISKLNVLLRSPRLGLKAEKPMHVKYSPEEISVSGLDVRFIPDGRLTLDGKLAGNAFSASGKMRGVHLEAYRTLVPALPKASLEADFALGGTNDRPKGGLTVRCSGLSIPDAPFPPLDFSLKADLAHTGKGSEVIASLLLPPKTLAAFGGKNWSAQVRLPLKAEQGKMVQPDMHGRLTGHVRFDGTISPLWKLVDLADRSLTGNLGLDCGLEGTLEKPEMSAKVRLSGGKYVDLPAGVLVDAINLEAGIPRTPVSQLAAAKMHMNFSATDGRKGRLSIRGGVDAASRALNITGTIRDFAPLRRRDVLAVLSGDLAVRGTPASPSVTGTINVDRGILALEAIESQPGFEQLKIENGPKERLVALLGKEEQPEEKAGRGRSGGGLGSLNVRFYMPPRFAVKGYGLDSVWGADMNVTGALTNPSVTGSVRAARGTLELLNRKFKMEKGDMSFSGGLEPVLDIRMATHAQDIDAYVNVGGTPGKIDFSLSSSPEMSQDDVLAYILFGKSSSELTQYELLQLGATMARMMTFHKTSSGILDFAKKGTGLDVINVNQAPDGGAKLEMGKYISDKIYVGVEKETSGSAETSAVIQMELGPHTNATAKTGGENTSAGVKWRLDY